ncbi:MAG: wax ester/triacylglycerol synthase family O-acyltransferase [Pseudomonadales bacterium]
MARLTASDASFLYAESASGPMHISSIYVLEGELPYERVLQLMAERIHLIPSYRRRLAMVPFNLGHPTWVEDDRFDLSYHVRSHDLGPDASLDDAIDYAVTLNEPMLDRTRPLWLMHVIRGVPDRTLILQMTHHCLIDGASGIELTTIIYDLERNPPPTRPPETAWAPSPPPGAAELFAEALRENVQGLGKVDTGVWTDPDVRDKQAALMRRAMEVGSRFVNKPAITASFNASIVGSKRRARYLKKSFADIREIRRSVGGTINDVVLAVISEAVARYLDGRREAVRNQHLRIMCPVNVRTESQKGALGNQVSAIFPMLPAWPMTVEARMEAVITEMERIKQDQDAQAMTLLTEASSTAWPLAMAPTQLVGTPFDATRWMADVPWPVMPNVGWRPPNPGINFVCTNVPGVQVPQYMAGHEVLDTIGLLILSGNIGFSLTILSYNKQLFFNFICEPRLMPDLENLVAHADAVFGELLEAASARASQQTGETA